MRAPGIIGLVQLAATLALAVPLAWFGLELLARGRTYGAAFLGIAALLVGLQRFLTNPLDPGDVAEAAIDRVTDDEE